ncbi:MAG: zinc-ribbon domain-containing protein [Ruminococcaceae bacterium]|nr:zinc-ribbon domain-containing protein [Oscillospiraceae bacterium]
MSKFCTSCGAPLQEGARFCASCGSQVSAIVPPAPVPVTPVAPVQEAVPPVVVPEEPTVGIWNDVMSEKPAPAIPVEEPAGSVWNDIMSDNPAPAIPVEEPAPVISEPTPAVNEPAAVISEPAPAASEPAPVYQDPTPIYTDPIPVYKDPAPAYKTPVATKTKAPKIRKPRGAGRTLLAILLCFVMFIFSFAAIVLNGAQAFVSEDTLETAMEEVVMELDEIPAIGLYTNIELEEDATMLDELVEVSEYMGMPMSKKELQEYLEDSELVSAIMDSTTGSVSNLLQGKTDRGLDKDEIIDLLEEDRDLIYDLTGEYPDDELIQTIADTVEDYGILELTDTKALKNDLGGAFTIIELVMSPTMVLVMWVVVALFVVLLFLTNRFSIGQTCGDTGIVLVVTSGLNLILAYLGFDLILSLLSDIPGADLFSVLATSFKESWTSPCLTVLAIGAVMLLVGILIKVITKPKKNA